MCRPKNFFMAILILVLILASFRTVNAANFNLEVQELRAKIMVPVLPDRLRSKKARLKFAREPHPPIEIPHRTQPKFKYTQRHPKKPPPIHYPHYPPPTFNKRGGNAVRNFGPPRSPYK